MFFQAGRTGCLTSYRRTARSASRQADPAVGSTFVPGNGSSGWLRGGSRGPDTDPSIGPRHRRIPTLSFRPHPLRRLPASRRQQLSARSKWIIATPGDGLVLDHEGAAVLDATRSPQRSGPVASPPRWEWSVVGDRAGGFESLGGPMDAGPTLPTPIAFGLPPGPRLEARWAGWPVLAGPAAPPGRTNGP